MTQLNEQQALAATAPLGRPLKIIAGAGTGKTETLARRFVNLVTAGYSPQRILMLTFTEKAAAEMRGRVTARLLAERPDLPTHDLLHPWIHTFHGFCARILADYTFWLRLGTPLLVLEEWQQRERWALIWQQFAETMALAPGWQPYNAAAQRWYAWHTGRIAGWVIQLVEQLRGLGLDARALVERRPPPDHEERYRDAYHQLRPLVGHCFEAYHAALQADGALDFAGLILATLQLFAEQPRIAASLRQRFSAILVDEFQDTDRAQLRLLEALDPGFRHTAVVGDPRQALYGWRQARVEHIINFPGRPDEALTIALRANYRSLRPICELANRAIAGYAFDSMRPEFDPAEGLIAMKREHPQLCVELRLTPGLAAEAAFVAGMAAQFHEQGYAYGQMALLLRSRTNLRIFEDALLGSGIPYEVLGGPGFYDLQEVRNTLALLRLLFSPSDTLALLRLLESDIVGLPDGALAIARRPAHAGPRGVAPLPALDDPEWLSHWGELLPQSWPGRAQAMAALERFALLYRDLQRFAAVVLPSQLLQIFWQRSGLRSRLLAQGTPGAMRRLLSLDRLLHLAEDYQARQPLGSLAGLSTYLARLAAGDDEPLPALGSGLDALQILTIHAAKGREFDIVFLADTRIPRSTSMNVSKVFFDETYGLIINEDDKHETIKQLRDEIRRRALNEERCIWYVALTRAREQLYILHDAERCELKEQDGVLFFSQQEKQKRQPHFFHQLWNELLVCQEDWRTAVALVDARAVPSPAAPLVQSHTRQLPAAESALLEQARQRFAAAGRLAERLAELRARSAAPEQPAERATSHRQEVLDEQSE